MFRILFVATFDLFSKHQISARGLDLAINHECDQYLDHSAMAFVKGRDSAALVPTVTTFLTNS